MARRPRVLAAWLIVAGLAMGARAFAEEKGAAKKEPKAEAKSEPASEKGAKTEASKDAKKETPATADKDAKKETKPETVKAAKEAKGEKSASKSDAKFEAKAEGKADAKGNAKTDAKSAAKGNAKTDAKSAAKSDGKKDTKTAQKAGSSKAAKSGESSAGAIGEVPGNGPITPPLKLGALRDEMSHPPVRHDEHAATKAEREKLEQLAAEINKAREGLRQDTAKLEAMLAARDAAPPPVASAGTPSSGDGEPAKKVPTPLDNLSKAIRGMKPEQAAPIISRVDRKLAADILLRMPGADAGKVMGVCKPEVAAEIAAEIASRTPRAELRR